MMFTIRIQSENTLAVCCKASLTQSQWCFIHDLHLLRKTGIECSAMRIDAMQAANDGEREEVFKLKHFVKTKLIKG